MGLGMGMSHGRPEKQQNWWNLASNHMGQEPVGVLGVELLAKYRQLRAGSEIGASGGGPEQNEREEGVLAAQPGDGQG